MMASWLRRDEMLRWEVGAVDGEEVEVREVWEPRVDRLDEEVPS